ncbi:energy-coupling factor transporter transmembrane component T family protein [Paenibacillus sp. FSL R7-0179]|uniref:energy-coupling factor transporter transmembrane component T family protein n=1 Tax=Paenibacillus sp. FSL R7-0179 TaxID=2921672 RepID=UPI0030FB66E8
MSTATAWGQYVHSNSVIHQLDPRTKLLSVVVFTLCCMQLRSPCGYLAAVVLAGSSMRLSRLPLRLYLGGLRPVLLFLLLPLCYHLLFNRSQAGIMTEIFNLWRILLPVAFALVLTRTTKPLDLAKGLEVMCKPLARLGIPVEAFALMVMLAVRFIPTISQELDRILMAQKARGCEIGSLRGRQRLQACLRLIIPLLVTTIGRAEQLAMTIEARAYGDGRGRTSFRVLHFSRMDAAAGGIMLVYTLLILSGWRPW